MQQVCKIQVSCKRVNKNRSTNLLSQIPKVNRNTRTCLRKQLLSFKPNQPNMIILWRTALVKNWRQTSSKTRTHARIHTQIF